MLEHNTCAPPRRPARPVKLAVNDAHPPFPVDWPDVEPDEDLPEGIPPPIQRRRGPLPFRPAPVMQFPGPDGPVLPLH
jgi:hypothetical protein